MKSFILTLSMLVFTSNVLYGAGLPPAQALKYGKDNGILPNWMDMRDNVQLRDVGGRIYICVQNKQTGDKFTILTSATGLILWLQTGLVTYASTHVSTTYTENRVCWPELPALPVTLGEPAYWYINCIGACDPVTGVPNLPFMDTQLNAGTPRKGELCGKYVGMGFYEYPQLQGDRNSVPVTRCLP